MGDSLGTIITVTCPYCGRINNLSWRWGDEGPHLKVCGLNEVYDKTLGCGLHFVVKVEWEFHSVGCGIEGEDNGD